MVNVKAYYQLTVRDANGKIVRRTRRKLSKSFVIAFLKIVEVQMRQITSGVTDEDTGGTSRTLGCGTAGLKCEAAIGASTYGIVVGTGTGAESNIDNALGTQIAHGTGSGQLSYGAMSYTTTAVVGANVDLIATRTFNNGSGASITVQEVAIYAYGALYIFCIVRDLTGAVAVANGQTLTVDYTLRTTV